MLIASLVLKEHPFEIKQENEVPELAAAIRECGIWPRHRSLAVFWSPSTARDRSCEFNVLGQDTLLGGAIERVKLDDGSYLNVLDDSDLADFIHHHTWFEGDEVALPRGDRVYLLGNHRPDAKETSSNTTAARPKSFECDLFLSDRDTAA